MRMGVNSSTFHNWSSGRSMPSERNFRKLCYHLEVSPEELRDGLPDLWDRDPVINYPTTKDDNDDY